MITEANLSLNNKALRGFNQLREFITKMDSSLKEIVQQDKASNPAGSASPTVDIQDLQSKLEKFAQKVYEEYPDEDKIHEQTQLMLEIMTQSKAKTTIVVEQASENLEQLKITSARLAHSIQQFKIDNDIDREKLNREINF